MKAWRDLKHLPRELWILCFATLINRMGTMVLPFLVLYFTKSLGFSSAQGGIALGVYGAVAFIVGPVAGRLSDRFGPLIMMEVTLFASGIVVLLFPLVKSWPGTLLMTVLFAATNESFRPANLALVGELTPPEQRKTGFALSRLTVNLGMSVGPVIGGLLATRSFPSIFIVDGATTLLTGVILIFSSFHRSVKKMEMQRFKETPPQILSRLSWKKRLLANAFFSDPNFRFFMLATIPVAMVFFQHNSAMPLFIVRDLQFSEAAYGALATINTILIIFFEIPLNAATSHWSFRRAQSLGAFLFALGFGALAFARSYIEIAATVIIWTFGEMILFPAMSAYVTEAAPPGKSGEYMGLHMMGFSFAFMLGPWLGTTAMQLYGPISLWTGSFFVGLVSVVMLARITVQNAPVKISLEN